MKKDWVDGAYNALNHLKGIIAKEGFMSRSITSQKVIKDLTKILVWED